MYVGGFCWRDERMDYGLMDGKKNGWTDEEGNQMMNGWVGVLK